MKQVFNIQETLFLKIKEKLPANVSFVHEIAELLEISYDSVYRRFRLEKELSLEELYKLCTHFDVSSDSLFNISDNKVNFSCHSITPSDFNVKKWLDMIHFDLQRLFETKEKEIIYAAKDPPFYHYFHFSEIAAFKIFFWQKTLFQFPEFEDKKFSFQVVPDEVLTKGKQILSLSTKIPTIEIWNQDTFTMMLRQIDFYWISGYFESKEDVLLLLDKTEKWIRHIQKQAELGFKFLYGQEPKGVEDSFKFYENEVVLNDNTIFARLDDVTKVYLTFNVLSLLVTSDTVFCDHIESYFKGLMRKSNLISRTNEKGRNRFFNKLIETVELFRSRIK